MVRKDVLLRRTNIKKKLNKGLNTVLASVSARLHCASDYFYVKCQALRLKINPEDQRTKTNSIILYNDD